MIPMTVSTATLERARDVAWANQLATYAGNLNTDWGGVYREIANEIERRAGRTQWPPNSAPR